MTDWFCPYCDASNTRQTILAVTLRNLWKLHHADLGHPGDWHGCQMKPCVQVFEVIEKRGTDVKVTTGRRNDDGSKRTADRG